MLQKFGTGRILKDDLKKTASKPSEEELAALRKETDERPTGRQEE